MFIFHIRLLIILNSAGYKTIHVNSILDKWYTKDIDICTYADNNDFIVITKDSDFRDSYFIRRSPRKLIKINLGNISNSNLIHILSEAVSTLQKVEVLPHFLIEIDANIITCITDEDSFFVPD